MIHVRLYSFGLKTHRGALAVAPWCAGRRSVVQRVFLHASLLLLLAACSAPSDSPKRIVRSVGLPSELLLVVDQAVWNSDLSDSLTQLLKGPVPGLMQAEPFFRLTRVTTNHYTPSYSTLHSKLFVQLDPSLKEPMMGISHNVVAQPQMEVTIAAPTLDELRAYLYHNGARARQYIADFQIEIRAARLRRKFSKKVDEDLRQVENYTICAPEEIGATKKGEHFFWAGTNRNEKDLNLVVYTCPWDGRDALTPEEFIARRDSVMMANIPGSNPDQWMQTTRVDGRPIVFCELRNVDGQTVQEVRGLWQMRNGALGGPFVSRVSIDTAQSRVVAVEGFVYSPSTDKRELVRTLEASLRTLRKL